jgi:hypothetical protein
MSGADLYEDSYVGKPRRRVRQFLVEQKSRDHVREAYFLSDEGITDFVMALKANTENAVELKKRRIPFQVYQSGQVAIDGCPEAECLEICRLVERILGKTALVVTDKKRLKDGPWLSPFEGQNLSEKLAFLARDVFGRILPYSNGLVFTAVRKRNWELSGYLLNYENNADLKEAMNAVVSFIEKYCRSLA